MKKNDFMSVIGYHGDVALVDKRLRSRVASKSMQQLIEEGQFKAAFCLSFFTGEQERQLLLDAYNKLCGGGYTLKELERLFGVYMVPDKVKIQLI